MKINLFTICLQNTFFSLSLFFILSFSFSCFLFFSFSFFLSLRLYQAKSAAQRTLQMIVTNPFTEMFFYVMFKYKELNSLFLSEVSYDLQM